MIKRLLQTVTINLIPSAHKRTEWMKKQRVFRMMGENVSLQLRKIPLYPQCIAFHDNIVVASNVQFITHDAIHLVLNRFLGEKKVKENVNCIEVMDNCFIGANSIILSGVRIGPNAIVAAGSMVNRDIPFGEIWGGVPAKKIGTFEDLLRRRLAEETSESVQPNNQDMPQELSEVLWQNFEKKRKEI